MLASPRPPLLQWAALGKQGTELILTLRKVAHMARDWGLWIIKLDLHKAVDSVVHTRWAQNTPGKPDCTGKGVVFALGAYTDTDRGGDNPCLPPQPHHGGSYMDDTYFWGQNPLHLQGILDKLERALPLHGLKINC